MLLLPLGGCNFHSLYVFTVSPLIADHGDNNNNNNNNNNKNKLIVFVSRRLHMIKFAN